MKRITLSLFCFWASCSVFAKGPDSLNKPVSLCSKNLNYTPDHSVYGNLLAQTLRETELPEGVSAHTDYFGTGPITVYVTDNRSEKRSDTILVLKEGEPAVPLRMSIFTQDPSPKSQIFEALRAMLGDEIISYTSVDSYNQKIVTVNLVNRSSPDDLASQMKRFILNLVDGNLSQIAQY